MKFTCNSCGAQYMISDEKVGPSGVKVRCKKCGNVVHVRRATEEAAAPAGRGGNGAAAAAPGLDAELGQAFDNVFGDPSAAQARQAASRQEPAAEEQPRAAAAAPAAAPAPAPTEWYVAIGQAQVGPLPLAEVKRKWEAGDVGPDSLVWRPGMGDWQPLSSVSELAGYLAPVARAAPAAAAPREEPATRKTHTQLHAAQSAAEKVAPGEPAAAGGEVSWKPAGASALAALASEEIAARNAPVERKPVANGPAVPSGVKSLVEALPDGGGVDPTGAIPLPMKALDQTSESKLERRSTVATRAEEARHKRSMTRVIAIAAAVVVVAVAGAATFVMTQKKPAPAPVAVAPPPAAAPAPTPPPVAQPPPVQAAPAPTPPAAVAAATPSPAAAPAPAPEPPAHKAEPEPTPQHKAAPPPAPRGKHGRLAKAEPPAHAAPAQAQHEAPTPAPAPTSGRKRDSLLDFDSNDSALDDALGGGGGGGGGRSVYVPPSRGASLPDKLSPAQINEAVAGRIDSLRRCVSEQKARDPAASGVLKMRWIITGDGNVRDVKALPGEYASGQFSTCITGVVKGIRFPRSTTSGQEVTFPFSF